MVLFAALGAAPRGALSKWLRGRSGRVRDRGLSARALSPQQSLYAGSHVCPEKVLLLFVNPFLYEALLDAGRGRCYIAHLLAPARPQKGENLIAVPTLT